MNFHRFSILCSLFFLVLFSCNTTDNKKVTSKNTSQNLCKHSRWLKIYDNGQIVTIKITNPDNSKQVFVFEGKLNSKQNELNSEKKINLPISKMAVLSSTHIGMLNELNAINTIAAISNVKYVYQREVKSGIKSGQIISLGDEGQISIDKLLQSKTKVMIYSAFSGEFSQQKKLDKLGIISIPNYDWRETTPLGKADWLLLFGYLTDKQKQAKEGQHQKKYQRGPIVQFCYDGVGNPFDLNTSNTTITIGIGWAAGYH